MLEGWLSSFAIAKEGSLLGAAAGPRIAIPGVRSIYLSPEVSKRMTRKNIFRRETFNDVIHQSWSVTISREFAADSFADFWLDAIADGPGITVGTTTTRRHRRDRPPVTFTADATVPGELTTARRLRGLALESVELVVQARRVVIEETTWKVLRNDALPIADVAAGTHERRTPCSAQDAMGSLALGLGAWTPAASPTRMFSGQIMAQREIEPAYFNEEGEAQRFTLGGPYELVGQAILSPEFGNLEAFTRDAATCRLFWRIGTASNAVEIEVQNGVAKVSGNNILHSGDMTTPLDWMARADSSGAFITRRIDA